MPRQRGSRRNSSRPTVLGRPGEEAKRQRGRFYRYMTSSTEKYRRRTNENKQEEELLSGLDVAVVQLDLRDVGFPGAFESSNRVDQPRLQLVHLLVGRDGAERVPRGRRSRLRGSRLSQNGFQQSDQSRVGDFFPVLFPHAKLHYV